MRSIKLLLMGRQRPLQFSEDCGGFDFLGTNLSRAGVCLLNDQVEPGLHFAHFRESRNVRQFYAAALRGIKGMCAVCPSVATRPSSTRPTCPLPPIAKA
jgi:hypothetical protein